MFRGLLRSTRRTTLILNAGGLAAFTVHKYSIGELELPGSPPKDEQKSSSAINVPGTNATASSMLPARVIVFAGTFAITYPFLLVGSAVRALYMRAAHGNPSQILAQGTYPTFGEGNEHIPDLHYPCQMLFKHPLDEARLRKVLVELCAEDGIKENEVELVFKDEVPQDWPTTGSFSLSHFVPKSLPQALGREAHYNDYVTGWVSDRRAVGVCPAVSRIEGPWASTLLCAAPPPSRIHRSGDRVSWTRGRAVGGAHGEA